MYFKSKSLLNIDIVFDQRKRKHAIFVEYVNVSTYTHILSIIRGLSGEERI